MTPGAWLLTVLYVVSIVVYGVIAFWAFAAMLQWFVTFWYPVW